jgi:hypothetical protein
MTKLVKLLLCFMAGAPASAFGSMASMTKTSMLGTPPTTLGAIRSVQQPTPFKANRLSKSEMSMSLSGVMSFPRGGSIVEAAKNFNSSPTSLFNASLVSLALLTAVFKVLLRASAGDQSGAPTKPKSVRKLQIRFLSVFWLLRCADWLQGPYFYEVYASKVFNGVPASIGLVSQLFLAGFASTALFGPLVGRAVDSYGRKKGTLAFAMIYAVGAFSTKSPVLQVLFLGRLMSGIGTSLLFSAPESWLVGESQKSGDDPDGSWLGETFGLVRRFFQPA